MEYTVLHNGEQFGPHTHQEVAAMLQAGTIDDSAMLWCAGWPNWLPVTNIIPPPIQRLSPASGTKTVASRPREKQLLHTVNRKPWIIVGILLGGVVLGLTIVVVVSNSLIVHSSSGSGRDTDSNSTDTGQATVSTLGEETIEQVAVPGVPTFESVLEHLPEDL